jgi:hypothetical protein
MARLVDLIRRGKIRAPTGYTPGEPAVRVMHHYALDMLSRAQIFVIDNVADYFYMGTDQEHWDEQTDFPNVAPPFPVFWMEWKKPARIVSRVHGITKPDSHADMTGVLMRVSKVDGTDGVRALMRHWFGGYATLGAKDQVEGSTEYLVTDRAAPPRWLLHASIYIQDYRVDPDGLPSGPSFEYMNTIDEHGRLTGGPSMLIPLPQEWVNENGHLFSSAVLPAFMALSLLHCKNVSVEENVSPPKLARSIQKRHGVAPLTYKTLVIEPMTRQIQGARNVGDTGRQLRLHIVRGRFRTYTEERPLFGKHAGTWWWDSWVRGDARAGVVLKDYEVMAPREAG